MKLEMILILLGILLLMLPLPLAAEESQNFEEQEDKLEELATYQLEDLLNAVEDFSFPNFEFSLGLKTGTIIPVGMVEDITRPFSTSFDFQYNIWSAYEVFGDFQFGITAEFELFYLPFIEIKNAGSSTLNILGFLFGLRLYMGFYLDFFEVSYYWNAGPTLNILDGNETDNTYTYWTTTIKNGFDVEFILAYHSSITLGFSYQFTPNFGNGLSGANVYTAYNFRLGAAPDKDKLKVENIHLQEIYPSLKPLYDSKRRPVAIITLYNQGDSVIENIMIGVNIDQYINSIQTTTIRYNLGRGEEKHIPLYATFNSSLLNQREDENVNLEVTIIFEIKGVEYPVKETRTLTIRNRNAVEWDRIEKILSFVSPNDPGILQIRSLVENQIEETELSPFLNNNLKQAIKAFAILKSFHLDYLQDQNCHFFNIGLGEMEGCDTIHFPIETLSFDNRTGDCDDFAVLYASLLESLGIPTGFLFINNPRQEAHILTLFNTGIRWARQDFITNQENAIIEGEDGFVWIPVETTYLDYDEPDFIQAWQKGMTEYLENRNYIQTIIVSEKRSMFPPVQINGYRYRIPETNHILCNELFESTIEEYSDIHKDIIARFNHAEYESLSSSEKRNKARELISQNQPELAMLLLEPMLSDGDNDFIDTLYYAYALYGQGQDFSTAIDYFLEAKAMVNENTEAYLPNIHINIAKCYYFLGNVDQKREYYNMVIEEDPELARRYEYLADEGQETIIRINSQPDLIENIPLMLDE